MVLFCCCSARARDLIHLGAYITQRLVPPADFDLSNAACELDDHRCQLEVMVSSMHMSTTAALPPPDLRSGRLARARSRT
jgi:hypothetical protein